MMIAPPGIIELYGNGLAGDVSQSDPTLACEANGNNFYGG